MTVEERKKRRIRKILLCVLIFLALVGGAVYRIKKDQISLEVTFYHVKSKNVENGMRIVQLSDLHLNEFGKNNEELISRVEKLSPDIIAITGDMNMADQDNYDIVLNLCRKLVGITDVYYVMGNHEFVRYANGKREIAEDIKKTGVHLLTNETEHVNVNGNEIEIGGLVTEPENYYERGGEVFMEKYLKKSGFKLLLVHYPEYFLGILDDEPIDLSLCGHTHGGIVRIPYMGGLYASEQGFFPELTEGLHEFGESQLIISRGLGNSNCLPRINNKPEIVVVDVNWY